MKRDNSIVGKYYKLPPKKRLDQIYYHYNQFEELVNNYEYEIAEWIKANKAKARRNAIGDLGVRVQGGNNRKSVVESEALLNLEIAQMLVNYEVDDCDIEDYEEIVRGLLEIKLMRSEFRRFNNRLRILTGEEKQIFIPYINQVDMGHRLNSLADEKSLSYDSAAKRIYRIKRKLYTGVVDRMECFDDESIYLMEGYDE